VTSPTPLPPAVRVPPELRGGWLRRSIAVGGGPAQETATVWWLQASTRFADLRVPLAQDGRAQSFAGATTWEPPALTWEHELDLEGLADSDTGRVHFDGELLVEEGEWAGDSGPRGYVEVWEPMPGTTGTSFALTRGAAPGRLVRTGTRALTLVDDRASGGDYTGVGWQLTDAGWTEALRWPPASTAVLPAPPGVCPAAGEETTLSDGSVWTVEESAGDGARP